MFHILAELGCLEKVTIQDPPTADKNLTLTRLDMPLEINSRRKRETLSPSFILVLLIQSKPLNILVLMTNLQVSRLFGEVTRGMFMLFL